MKKLTVLVLSLLLLTGCASGGPSYQQISQEEAARILEQEENILILDVRTPEEFAAGHIKGAVNLPNEDIGPQNLSLLPDRNQKILVYCRSGNRSKQASQKLAELGYTGILEFGGINTWTGELEK